MLEQSRYFADEDFALSFVTDRPLSEAILSQAVSNEESPSLPAAQFQHNITVEQGQEEEDYDQQGPSDIQMLL